MKWITFITIVVAFAVCSVMSTTPVFAKAGDLLFQYKLGENVAFTSPAIGTDGTIYACGSTYDWNIIGYNTNEDGYEYPVMEYTNGDYGLMAFLSNGTLKWKYPLTGNTTAGPSIDSNGTIYLGIYDRDLIDLSNINRKTNIFAVNPDGTTKWMFSTDNNICVGSQFAIGSDNTIYFSAYDYVGIRSLNYTLYALNPDGTLKWKFNSGKTVENYPSPVIAADGTIYFAASDVLYAVNSNGTVKWEFKVDPGWFNTWSNVVSENEIAVTPTIDEDGTIYFGNQSYFFYALNPNGNLKWKYDSKSTGYNLPFIFSNPVIRPNGDINIFSSTNSMTFSNNGILVDHNMFLRWEILEWNDSNESWAMHADNSIIATPAIDSEGTLYVGDDRRYLPGYTGDIPDDWTAPSELYALNPDGTTKWKYDTEVGFIGSPVISSDGVLLAVDYHGMLYAFETGTQAGPADSPWPMLGRNQFRTNNAGDDRVAKIGVRNASDTAVEIAAVPMDFAIKGNYPNPFNPTTTIEFSLGKTEKTNLTIYNIAGQRVRDLIVDASMAPGIHSILWNGKDESGKAVSSGIYFARLSAGTNTAVKNMMMVK